ALGYRVSDEFTVPVCRIHHRELHRSGDEAAWWQKLNIDPLPVALRLWQRTRLNGDEFAASGDGTPPQAAQKLDMSVQDQTGTHNDTRAESAISKDADPAASGCPRFDRSRLIEYALRSSGPKRSWQTTIAAKCSSARRTAESVVIVLEIRPRPPKHSKTTIFRRRSNSRRARSGASASTPLWCMRHAIAVSEFSRVSTDRVSVTSGITSSWPHSLASYAVENHRTAVTSLANRGHSKERRANEFTVRLCYVGHLKVGVFTIRTGRPKNNFRGHPGPIACRPLVAL